MKEGLRINRVQYNKQCVEKPDLIETNMKFIKCFFIFIIGLLVCYITMALIGILGKEEYIKYYNIKTNNRNN